MLVWVLVNSMVFRPQQQNTQMEKQTKQQNNKTTNVNPNAMRAHTCLTFGGGGRGGLQIGRLIAFP